MNKSRLHRLGIVFLVAYVLGYLYVAMLMVRFLRIMWRIDGARSHAVVFAVCSPVAIAFYPVWLPVLWSPRSMDKWFAANPDIASEYAARIEEVRREMGEPRTLLDRWRMWLRTWRAWQEVRR